MKKVTFLLATLLIGGMMLTGCKKDPQPSPSPTPTPTPSTTTKTVVYKMDNTFKQNSTTQTLSPGFHYKFSYKDANGTMVEVNDPTLPWTKEISVTTPFEAKLEGNVTYNENELPTEGKVYFGTLGSISSGTFVTPSASALMSVFSDKQQFLDFMSTHPDKLSYSFTLSIN